MDVLDVVSSMVAFDVAAADLSGVRGISRVWRGCGRGWRRVRSRIDGD
jgi:hypothetical protein